MLFSVQLDRDGLYAAAQWSSLPAVDHILPPPELPHLQQLPCLGDHNGDGSPTNTTLFRASTGRCMSSGPAGRDNPEIVNCVNLEHTVVEVQQTKRSSSTKCGASHEHQLGVDSAPRMEIPVNLLSHAAGLDLPCERRSHLLMT